MIFKDRNEEKKGFLDKCRKRMKQVARVAMAVAVGGCLWGQGEVGLAGTIYQFINPVSNNEIVIDSNGNLSSNNPPYEQNEVNENSVLVGGGARVFVTSEGTIIYAGIGTLDGEESTKDSFNNKLTVNGGTYKNIWGGVAGAAGNTANNIVTINNGNIDSVNGGQTQKGTAWNNTVIVNGGELSEIHGGESQTSNVENNVVEINGGSVSSRIVGGFTGSGNASNNSVIINGGNISNTVVAGSSASGNVSNNSVIIKGGEISNSVFAGICASGNKNNTNNSINIYNDPNISNATLYGDGASRENSHPGNTLNIHTYGLTAQNIYNFESINFYLPPTIKNGDTVLTLTSGVTSLKNTAIRAGVEGNANISNGDVITLIKNENGIYTDETTTYGKLTEGVSMDYDLTVEKADDTSIVARVGSGSNNSSGNNGSSSLPSLNPQTNFLPKPLLSTSTLTLQGTDRLLDWLPPEDFSVEDEKSGTQEEAEGNTGKVESDGGVQIIANAGVSSMRIKTGANSYMNNHSGGFDVGMARTIRNRHGRLIFAPIVDYGSGTYDAYTDDGRKMHGWGSTKYWAGGMIARQINDNGIYYEGSFRAGRTTLDFSSDDFLVQGNPTYEHYDTSAPFFAGHLRVGRVYQIARNNQLHLYGIYSHTHQNGMTAHLSTGETYNFSAVDSGRLRIGARLSWQKKKTQRFYSGLAYQYEYATGVSGTYRGRSTDSSGIHGSSVMLELGWQVKPSERSSWMVDVGAVGWVGHQKGVAFQVQMKKAF